MILLGILGGLYFRIKALMLILILLLPLLLMAHSGRDTLLVVKTRKGDRLVKAQVYESGDSARMIFFRPKPFGFLTRIPSDFADLYKVSVKKENLGNLGMIVGTTAALIAVDQHITDAVNFVGNGIGLDPDRLYHRVELSIGSARVPIIDIPKNLNSIFYSMGEGWPSLLIAGSFWGYGLCKNDYRARQTSSQLLEMFVTLGVTVQAIKRISGRQSPFRATQPGGAWHPLTNPGVYQKDVSNYDAFPSGHLATAMATVTVIAGNYPDNHWVKPVGYSLMGVLGFAMIHNGVHWMGDYPLALAIGYASGRIALSRGHKKESRHGSLWSARKMWMPVAYGNGGLGLSYRCVF
ncbi:MAG: phosphatase PAP2 family protein [Marinilabiliales bacterium]|nr:phosphatase PAP2 family protein [Marinilabiliales bacterium]